MSNRPATFADHVLFHARTHPLKPAIILADRAATYAMLAQGMMRVQNRVRTLSLPAGEAIGIVLGNPIRHLVVAAALYRLGHPILSAASVASIAALGLPIRTFLVQPGQPIVPGLRQALVSDDWFTDGDHLLDPPAPTGFLHGDAICRIDISSGATGRPKAVSTTVDAIGQRVANCWTAFGGRWDRLLCLPGLTGSWGFTLAAHALQTGRTLLMADSAPEALHMISIYGAEAVAASPQQLRDLLEAHSQSSIPCGSLRTAMIGGSLLPAGLLQEARAHLCNGIANRCGSTEMGLTAVGYADSQPDIDGAMGYVVPGAQVEIVNEALRPVAAGAEGLVRVRTPWGGQPFPASGDTASDIRDGWFYPGDIGSLHADGLLVLHGRASEVINSGGVKSAPELIEEIVLKHPNVADVAAFGAPGAGGLDEITLAVIARDLLTEQQLIVWCAARGLEVAHVYFVDDLPRTPMGKIRRTEIRQRLIG